jgi:hypothetical protein
VRIPPPVLLVVWNPTLLLEKDSVDIGEASEKAFEDALPVKRPY